MVDNNDFQVLQRLIILLLNIFVYNKNLTGCPSLLE